MHIEYCMCNTYYTMCNTFYTVCVSHNLASKKKKKIIMKSLYFHILLIKNAKHITNITHITKNLLLEKFLEYTGCC